MSFKHQIMQTATSLGISGTRFGAVNVTDWKPIIKKIEDKFVNARYDSLRWWWDGNFKGAVYGTVSISQPFMVLSELIPSQQSVWFVVED